MKPWIPLAALVLILSACQEVDVPAETPDAAAITFNGLRPHKYVEGGKYLRISDEGGGEGVLVFATGADGRVSEWRIGVPPQVDYVEGCS